MKILNDLAIALVQPKRYKELLKNSAGRVAVYVIIAVLVLAVNFFVSSVMFYNTLGEYYKNSVPYFKFENNALSADDTFNFSFGGIRIMIDTTRDLSNADFESDTLGVLADADSITVRSATGTVEVPYSEITESKKISFDKNTLTPPEGFYMFFIIVTAVCAVVLTALEFLFNALITALISMIFVYKNTKISFGKRYKLSLYSLALPTLLAVVLPNIFGSFGLIARVISVVFVCVAISGRENNEPEIIAE